MRRVLPTDCDFAKLCDMALFGFNDKTLRHVTAQECKNACLEETEFECRSVDYVADSQSCYLSQENAITQAVHIGPHFGADHYSIACGDEYLSVGFTPVEGSNCGFTKQCGMALFGFNTKTIDYITTDDCMRACVEETEFDCLSFDYSSSSQSCFLSEESASTQGVHMGPHFDADYYQKVCEEVVEGSGSYQHSYP